MNPATLTVGDPLREGWDTYRRFWRHLVPIAFVIYLVVSVIDALLVAALGTGGAVLGSLVSLVGVFLLQATLVEAVADVRDGRVDLTLGETVSRGWKHAFPALAVGIVAAIGIFIGFVLVIVPGLYLLTMWSVVIPVVVLESVGTFAALGRSRELVRGNGWTVFGVLVSIFVLDIVVGIVLALVLHGLSRDARSFVSSLVSNTVLAPFIAASLTSLYFRLRGQEESTALSVPVGAAYREE
jgi:hypothetical protein